MFLRTRKVENTQRKKRPTTLKSKKKRKAKPTLNTMGWNTTDADEIERRQIRAQTETFKSQPIEQEYGYFGSFYVGSKQPEKKYYVEIRSLAEHINSCDCPDYRHNGLGTCKHIEHVLFRLQKKQKKAFKLAAQEGSPRTEIYIDRREINTMRVAWSNVRPKSQIYQILSVFFNADGTLQQDPLLAYPKIKSIISKMRLRQQKQIRISSHIDEVLENQHLQLERQQNKEKFLVELEQGKHKLNFLKHQLYPYQELGMLHLVLTERALLSDEMGLGKTVQAIAACGLLNRLKDIKKVLVIATASLKAEWAEQIAKFTTQKSLIIQGSRPSRLKQYEQPAFFYLCNYEQIIMDGPDIMRLLSPEVIILDEAQRIKNWQTKTANAVKMLKSRYAFVLTGTPLENRIDDIYSVIQFLNPDLFGPLFRFNRDFYQLGEDGRPIGYKNLDVLHKKLQPVMLRRRKHEVEGQLPNRTVNNYFVRMEVEQRKRYDEYKDRVARLLSKAKRQPLRKEEYEKMQKWLSCMRMICDTPYILDPKCRISPKLHELTNILEELLEDPTAKIIIFSEWERMLQLVRELAEKMDIAFAWHTGKVRQQKRRQEINRFKEEPYCRLFLSTDAGSLGLNLQAANVVINLDLPWNPAKLEQRIARAWRKHQTRTVQVINFVCEDSIEHRMLGLLSQKKVLAQGVLEGHDDLKEMELPSGRAAFMERMEELMAQPTEDSSEPQQQNPIIESALTPTTEILPTTENIATSENSLMSIISFSAISESTTTDATPHIDPTIPNEDEGLELFTKKIKHLIQQSIQVDKPIPKVMLAIVDHHSEQAHITSKLNATITNSTCEVIDRNTFETIQRLVKSGILSLNDQTEILSSSEDITKSLDRIQEEQITKGRQALDYAMRKQKMAKLLIDQAFWKEGVTPLQEALESTIYAFSCLTSKKMNFTKEMMTHQHIQEKLIKHYGLPQKALLLLTELHMDNLPEVQITFYLKGCEEIYHYVNDFFEKSSKYSLNPTFS
jgi:superfamily II DNA/RNA helicase